MTASSSVSPSAGSSSTEKRLILGVDGGGTKTLAWLAQLDQAGQPQVIGRGKAGSSNRVAVGLEAALENLSDAIKQATNSTQIARSPITNAVFALAGAGTPEVQQQVLDFVQQNFALESVRVVHDGLAVLQAGTPDGWGIALIVGTGAVATGKSPTGEMAVVGGWGYWFGDEGSAYWLGQSALRAIAQADDGRAGATALTDAVLGKLQLEEPREILVTLSCQGEVRHEIADLASLVCEAAEQQDEVACRLVAQAAQHWSHHLSSLTEQLKLGNSFPLAIAGGVLCGSPYAREQLLRQLEQDQLTPSTIQFVDEPVLGCLQLASQDLQSRK